MHMTAIPVVNLNLVRLVRAPKQDLCWPDNPSKWDFGYLPSCTCRVCTCADFDFRTAPEQSLCWPCDPLPPTRSVVTEGSLHSTHPLVVSTAENLHFKLIYIALCAKQVYIQYALYTTCTICSICTLSNPPTGPSVQQPAKLFYIVFPNNHARPESQCSALIVILIWSPNPLPLLPNVELLPMLSNLLPSL